MNYYAGTIQNQLKVDQEGRDRASSPDGFWRRKKRGMPLGIHVGSLVNRIGRIQVKMEGRTGLRLKRETKEIP